MERGVNGLGKPKKKQKAKRRYKRRGDTKRMWEDREVGDNTRYNLKRKRSHGNYEAEGRETPRDDDTKGRVRQEEETVVGRELAKRTSVPCREATEEMKPRAGGTLENR